MKKLIILLALLTLATSASANDWKYTEESNVMTGVNNSTLITMVDGGMFAFKCFGNHPLAIIVGNHKYYGERFALTYRIDDSDILYTSVDISGGLVFFSKEVTLDLLASKKKVIVQAIRHGVAYDYVVDTSNMPALICTK